MRHSALTGAREMLSEPSSAQPRKTDAKVESRVSAAPSDNFANKYLEFMGGDENSVSKARESAVSKPLPPQQDLF
jgi:hypothetical protein